MDLFNKIKELISSPGAFCLFWSVTSRCWRELHKKKNGFEALEELFANGA